MKDGLAWLIFIVDRSGSMCGIASEMEEAIGKTLRDQEKNYEGTIFVTLALFDDEYELVFKNKPISDVDRVALQPRGMTALLDGVGKTVTTIKEAYDSLEENEKPERVLFFIVSDGGENSSTEYTYNSIGELKATLEKEYEWNFSFIGTDEAMGEGERMGVASSGTLNYVASSDGIQNMTRAMSSYATQYLKKGVASYTDNEENE